MTSTTEAENIGQRLLARVQSEFPTLFPLVAETIYNASINTVDVNAFRKQLNQALRCQLSNLPVNTIEIRICLDDDDNFEYWYRQLTTVVLPFWSDSIK
jgi:predicted protein tyrosine phosphatase